MVRVVKRCHSLHGRRDVLGFESEFTCCAQEANVKAYSVVHQRQGDAEVLVLHRDEEGLVVIDSH